MSNLTETGGVRIAVEGCGHGTLNAIYSSVQKACEAKGWDGVDLLIIGGDFQAVRNGRDLNCMAVPAKYREIGDFHAYYSGARTAPFLTIFIGGNHEASNYLWELYYGGWVCPNIYYLGAANVLRFGGLRIAGLSGIWKGYNYKKPHYERLPYNQGDVRSIYHVRELDVRKLLQVKTNQIDIGLSHDWPRGIEWHGNHKALFRAKDQFEAEARAGTLGSQAARYVLDRLRPLHWFAAHLHVKFAAVLVHEDADPKKSDAAAGEEQLAAGARNDDEIDVDMSDVEEETKSKANGEKHISEELRSELPDSFRPPPVLSQTNGYQENEKKEEIPAAVTNKTTNFLALDKCLPHRQFLQLLEITPNSGTEARPYKLEYDEEWLAITRAYNTLLELGDAQARPASGGDMTDVLAEATRWISDNVVSHDKLTVPSNFEMTAPAYDEAEGIMHPPQPVEYSNPQTQVFCELVGIANKFDASEDEKAARIARGPAPDAPRGDGHNRRGPRGGGGGGGGGGRGGYRGRGRGGQGRGRGQRGRGYGFG